MQRLHDRSTSLLTFLSAVLGRVAADLSLDDVELSYFRQHLGRQWRLGRDKEDVEIRSATSLLSCNCVVS
jgi:hypothetical protein